MPRKSPNVAYRPLATGDEGVILHLVSGQYHGINDVGCKIWELVDGRRTVAEVAEALREQVEEAPPHLVEDVISFLDDMRRRDLLA